MADGCGTPVDNSDCYMYDDTDDCTEVPKLSQVFASQKRCFQKGHTP